MALGLNFRVLDQALAIDYSDRTTRVIPFSWFVHSGNGAAPDFQDVEIIDDGLVLRLGSYKADLMCAYAEHQPV